MPVLDLTQDRHDILGHRARAQAGVGNRNHGGRDLVGKISSGSRRFRKLGIEGDFLFAHLSALKIKDDRLINLVQLVFRVAYGVNPSARRSSEEASWILGQ